MPTLSYSDWVNSLQRILFRPAADSSGVDQLLSRCPLFSPESPILPGSRVLVRADIDVPLDKARKSILDNERLKTLRETIEICTKLDAIPVILGHVGRDRDNTSAPLTHELEKLYRRKCTFVSD